MWICLTLAANSPLVARVKYSQVATIYVFIVLLVVLGNLWGIIGLKDSEKLEF